MKNRSFAYILLLAAPTIQAAGPEITVPNTPSNGDVADVTLINANFDYLEAMLSFTYATGHNLTIGATNNPTVFWDEANDAENPTGVANVGIGFEVFDDLRLGTGNVAYGFSALNAVDDGKYNTAVGTQALTEVLGGSFNTALGWGASKNLLTGTYNIALGVNALGEGTTGDRNIAIGYQSLKMTTSQHENVSIGDMAMRNHTGGHRNVAIGSDALGGFDDREGLEKDVPTTGHSNVAVGPGTLRENTGNLNVAIGAYASASAGHNFLRGVAVGFGASAATDAVAIGSGAEATGTNSVALGANATVTTDNTIQIGGSDVTSLLIATAASVNSDARLKEAIAPVEAGLALINDLKPVKYHRINNQGTDLDMGLLAQDVESALMKHGMSDVGTVRNATDDGYRSVRYNDLLAPIIKAIQELDAQHKKEVAVLEKQLKSQQDELLVIVQSQQEQIARLESMLERTLVAR